MTYPFANLQPNTPSAEKLRVLGSTLFVSAGSGGEIVIDISDPLAPHIISAGNKETMQAVDYYKDRMIAVSESAGMQVFQLPGALVAERSFPKPDTSATRKLYEIGFNELVTVASVSAPGSVTVNRRDTGEEIAATVEAVDEKEGAARAFPGAFRSRPTCRVRSACR